MPYFYVRPGWRRVEEPSEEWREGVNSGRVLVTQLTDGVPTSSSSETSLMAQMLELLDVSPGHRVLEVGTGTGFNAGLLCHQLGSSNVTSVDVDETLVEQARTKLAELGYHPYLHAGDGFAGCAERAPFDRIIATVGIGRVAEAWIAQTAPGGKILFPLDRGSRGALMVLLTVSDGKAEGRFVAQYGSFMPVRADRKRFTAAQATIKAADGVTRKTSAKKLTSQVEFFTPLVVGAYAQRRVGQDTWFLREDGSWARLSGDEVTQGGPEMLWDKLEAAYEEWRRLGEPDRTRFGLTVADGDHTVWLDDPGGPHRWALPE